MLKKVLLKLLVAVVLSASWLSTVPARAEVQDWLPDSDKWSGEQSRGFLTRLRGLLNGIVTAIKEAVDGIFGFFQGAIDIIGGYFESLLELNDAIWSWVTEMLLFLWGKLFEFLEFYFETMTELMIHALDWWIGTLITFITFVLDMLPSMGLPSGFGGGLGYFISYGMLLNQIFPFAESLAWFVIYMIAFIMITIYRIVKSLIPFVAT